MDRGGVGQNSTAPRGSARKGSESGGATTAGIRPTTERSVEREYLVYENKVDVANFMCETALVLGLAQMMKIVMDSAQEFPEVRIVALGAVDTARQVVEYDPEMKNRVAELHVPLMEQDELRAIIAKGGARLNVTFDRSVVDAIVRHCSGLAGTCHQLCLNACLAAGVLETCEGPGELGPEDFNKSVEQYIEESSDTLKAAFSAALRRERVKKYDNGRLILAAMAECEMEGASHAEILRRIRKREPQYPAANLTQYLEVLQRKERGGLVRYDRYSNTYSYVDPLSRTFAGAYFRKDQKIPPVKAPKEELMITLQLSLEQLLKSMRVEARLREIGDGGVTK